VIAGAIIERYYAQIDAQDIDGVLSLFAEDAAYERADARYAGKPAIEDFFRHRRQIRGEHRIEKILSLGSEVVAVGHFEGRGAEGDSRSVGFVDLWSFDAQSRVRLRRTFLATGHQIVER
jgi:ketosteroid isomerase-like protein